MAKPINRKIQIWIQFIISIRNIEIVKSGLGRRSSATYRKIWWVSEQLCVTTGNAWLIDSAKHDMRFSQLNFFSGFLEYFFLGKMIIAVKCQSWNSIDSAAIWWENDCNIKRYPLSMK